MDFLNNMKNKITNQDDNETKNNKKSNNDENDPLSLMDQFGQQVKKFGHEIEDRVNEVKSDVKASFNQLDDKLRAIFREYQQKINKWARGKVMDASIIMFEKLRPIAKQAIKDPDMCDCVKNLVDDIVDDVWPEIMDEVKYQLLMKIQDPYIEVPQNKIIACLYPFYQMRNWYLYSVNPYNRTIWKQFRTISWWFWTLVGAIPFYGISQFFYVFHFFMMDKSDEYQLLQFILNFKAMYFVTQGIQKAVIGYFILYSCTTMINKHNINDLTKCSREGPGASMEVFTEVIGFLLQIVFIWLAFLMLPCSKQKGRPVFRFEDERPLDNGCCVRGGRMKYFIIYDVIALGATVGLFILVFLLDGPSDFDKSGDYIFFAQVIYGLLSLPFLLFKIPLLKDRLTKAKATAYDRKGNCVPTYSNLQIVEVGEKGEKSEKKGLMESMTIDVDEVFAG